MLKEYLSGLANAFRTTLGITEKINAQDFTDKVNEVYEAGKQAEWSKFWDNYQDYGIRTNYRGAFSCYDRGQKAWTKSIFKPKYDMRPHNASQMFAYNTSIGDLAQILKDCNVKIDFSQCTNMSECFGYSSISHIPEIDTRSLSSLQIGCYNVGSLHTIDKIIFKNDGSQTANTSFITNASSLKNIVAIEGLIGANLGINASKSLTHDSSMNFINHLQDLIEAGKSTCTLTLGTTNLARLTDEEKAIATQKGWTLA